MNDNKHTTTTQHTYSFSELIESISKFTILLGGLCYILGIIVVSIHFNNYHLFSLSFFRTGYIFAGAWTLFIIITVGFCAYVVIRKIKVGNKNPGTVFLIRSYYAFVYSTLILSMFFGIIMTPKLFFSKVFLFFILTVFMLSGSTVVMIERGEDILYKDNFIKALNNTTIGQLSWIVWFIMCLLGFFSFFATGVYPYIPSGMGGGEHKTVIVIPKTEAYQTFLYSSIKLMPIDTLNHAQKFSEPIRLLFKGEDESYFIIDEAGKEHAVSIRNDMIRSLIYSDSLTTEMKEVIKKKPEFKNKDSTKVLTK